MIKLFSALIILLVCSWSRGFQLQQFPTYEEHRKQFDQAVEKMSVQYKIDSENWPVFANPQISTKAVLLQNKTKKQSRVIVISSGIHGVESYVGSSIQIEVINSILKNKTDPKTDFAFVHILNPWGMVNNRRVNADNIDLNRNFVFENQDFENKNTDYEKIDSFLNPKSGLQLNFGHRFLFLLDSMYYIFKFSMESLRQAILKGQYQLPKGIYFGGQKYSELKSNIDHFVDDKLKDYQEIVWVDLHTGYGQNGKLHLLANDSNDTNSENLKKLLPDEAIDFGQNKKFYKTMGDMISYLSHKLSNKKFTGVVFEFGTMDSQKALGSIESLRRMVIENQSHFNNPDSEDRKQAEKLLLDMYNPDRSEWWTSIQEQTQNLIEKIFKN